MAGYKWDKFGGIRPLATVLRLKPNESVNALNVDLHRGVLRPRIQQTGWDASLHPSVLLDDGADVPETLFRFHDRSNDDSFWMYWTTDVDVAPGPVENAEQRHYYTGDGAPKLFTKDSIDDATPPYPEPADGKYPMTWYLLGVPAPVAAPTIDGDSYVPPDTAKTGSITGLEAPAVIMRYQPKVPHRTIDRINAFANGESDDPSGETHMDSNSGAQRFEVLQVGTRVKVTEIVGADEVRVSGTVGNGHFEEFGRNYDDPIPENRFDDRWTWDVTELTVNALNAPKLYYRINGKENDICWTYHIADGAVLTIPSHSLKVGDVLRVTAAAEAMHWETATRLLAGAPNHQANGRLRPVTEPGETSVVFTGDLTYFVERDGREFDPTIEDVMVESREPTTRAYVYTYVTSLGEEGPPSSPTDPFTLALGDSVSVEGFTAPPTEHRDITLYRLYRSNTGSQETAFQFVADIPIADTSYTDEMDDDELGEVLQSETWEPPPSDMIGICAMPNGFLAGFFENVLCFSEPGFPHAWPVEYRMPLDVEIVGIKVAGGSLIVATEGTPYVVAGTHPRQMASRRVEEPSPCVDKRSMVDCGDTIVYASTDGLISASNSGFSNVTEQYFTREQWLLVVGDVDAESHSVRAWFADGEYVLQYSQSGSAGYVFDFRGGELQITNTNDAWRAAFTDPKDGELYYITSVNEQNGLILVGSIPASSLPILRWRYLYPTVPPAEFDGSGVSHALYNSGRIILPRPMAISVVKVLCRRGQAADFSFGRVKLSLSAYRYDSSSTFASRFESFHGTELCFETLIDGDVNVDGWPGEQRSQPFRVNQNVLVDALDFYLDMFGAVEVEAVYVAESFDDLVMLEG